MCPSVQPSVEAAAGGGGGGGGGVTRENQVCHHVLFLV